MNVDSLITKVLPTMLQAWLFLAFLIIFGLAFRKMLASAYSLIRPIIEPSKGQIKLKSDLTLEEKARDWYKSFQSSWLSAPNNVSMALKSAWRRACSRAGRTVTAYWSSPRVWGARR